MLPLVEALPSPWKAIAYGLAFLCGLALLERGADWFTDASAAIAERLHAPQTLVGLLTAGGEWEELVVALAAVTSGHAALALGDILGSTIANILGSFPLGLLGRAPLVIERSARFYAVALAFVTLLVSALLAAGPISRPIGAGLVALFALYCTSELKVPA
jgi:Ca2+/Na+ antiporter